MKVNKKKISRSLFFSVQPILDFENLITTGNGYFAKSSCFSRDTQREYSSKPLKHIIVERILVF